MGFFDIVSSIISSAARSTAKSRAKVARDYERKNPNMSSAKEKNLKSLIELQKKWLI